MSSDNPSQAAPTAEARPRGNRSTASDGFRNRLERYFLTHFGPLWRLAQAIPPLERRLNKLLINGAVEKCPARPNPLSLMADYPSWDSLTDRSFTGRHLPPADEAFQKSLPPIERVLQLFERPKEGARLSAKSTALFGNFAQWFTDGFLRTDRHDFRKNTSNYEIDLSTVYGRTRPVAFALRARDGTGKLRSNQIPSGKRPDGKDRVGGEFPPFYFEDEFVNGKTNEARIRPEFADTAIAHELRLLELEEAYLRRDPERMRTRFALGVERANNQIGYVMHNVLFLREHNRLCALLRAKHPDWDDDRLYYVARNTVIVMLLRIVVEEYVNHIAPYHFKFRAQPQSFYASKWYRTNWMTVEFNLLYRWHGLVTDTVRLGDQTLPVEKTLFNNTLLIDEGLAVAFDSASRQKAGEITLRNTPSFLVNTVEKASLELARKARLRSYNDYREYARFPRVKYFEEITGDEALQGALRDVYGSPDNVEFFVGLFAEDVQENSAVPMMLLGRLVTVDAFSQAMTNPLLSERVFRPETFAEGWEEFMNTRCLDDVVRRNIPGETLRDPLVTMTQQWRARSG